MDFNLNEYLADVERTTTIEPTQQPMRPVKHDPVDRAALANLFSEHHRTAQHATPPHNTSQHNTTSLTDLFSTGICSRKR